MTAVRVASSSVAADQLALLLKVDIPSKSSSLKINSSVTVAELKQAVIKSFGMNNLAGYDWRFLAFGQDAKMLTNENQTLNEVGMRSKAIVYLSAPFASRPLPPLSKAALKVQQERKVVDRSVDRYRNLTPKNILRKLMLGLRPKEEAIALEFIEMYTSAVLRQPEFQKLPRRYLKLICEQPGLNVSEIALWDAVVEWAQTDCKVQGREANAENLRRALGDVVKCIRFPVMSMMDVAAKVTPTNILSPEQNLKLYQFLGSSAEEQKRILDLPFTEEKRVARKPHNVFSFDPTRKGASIQLSSGNMIASINNDWNWNTVFGDNELKSGVVEWEVELTQYDTQNTLNVVIGVVPANFTNYTLSTFIGYHTSPGWGFVTGTGQRVHGSEPQQFSSPCYQGDVVRVRLDLDRSTMEIFRGAGSLGVMYTDIIAPVRAAVSLVTTQRVTLRMLSKAQFA